MGGGKSGGGGGTQVVEQRSNPEPPAIQKPYLEDIYKLAQQAYGQVSKTPYGGDLIAGPTSQQTQALGQQEAYANQLQQSGFGQNALDMANKTASGYYLDPNQNPFLAQNAAAAMRPVEEAFFERVMPSLVSGATMSGAYGGTADTGLRQEAGRNFAREASDATNRVYADNYARERGFQMQSPSLLNQAVQSTLLPSNLLGSVGETYQGFNQGQNDEAYQQYQLEQLAPFLGLPEYASLVNTGNFSGGSSTSTTTGNTFNNSSRFGGLLQGAFGGAQLGGSLGGGWGAAGGAALGGLMGLFG